MQKSLYLVFGEDLVNQPIVSTLARKHEVEINILEACVNPNEEGQMFVRLQGSEEQLEQSVQYLTAIGVQVKTRPDWIQWHEEVCVSCGACVAQCLPKALSVDPASQKVGYDQEKCIACLLCLDACPYGAVEEATP